MNKMEKEFIPYEEALDLKELGFDEPCIAWWFIYNNKPHLHLVENDEGEDNNIELDLSNSQAINAKELETQYKSSCSAPTFSQAFRWFREKHTLYHDIKMFGDWDKPQFSYIVSGRTITNPAHMWHYESKDSYEEVELECLKKLIQIVKNK